MTNQTRILQLRTGQLQDLADTGAATGIYKQNVKAAFLSETGLEQDEHGDTRRHGGPEKALHHFASDHYARLQKILPVPAADRSQPGGFGENLVTEGLTETDVCVGDIYNLGEAILQVSQPRQPCWRLNARFGISDMSRRLQNTLRTGWYYRVLQEGMVRQGDTLTLEQRPKPEWPLSQVLSLLYETPLEQDALAEMAELEQLSPNLRQLARKRLETGEVEDWEKRLFGPGSISDRLLPAI
ncbi:MAG: MOSC domain-containing protein [Marinobacter sp.]|uniref:MOSC domain-containing protein n=1 Tax=Marinobacter sp. TaxID=50741 RepID=UPI00396EFA5A